MLMNAPAVSRCQSWRGPLPKGKAHGDHLVGRGAAQDDQGYQKVIPNPKELEDGKGSQGRDRKRQDQAGKTVK
jgi:hypothetical protein